MMYEWKWSALTETLPKLYPNLMDTLSRGCACYHRPISELYRSNELGATSRFRVPYSIHLESSISLVALLTRGHAPLFLPAACRSPNWSRSLV